MTLARRLLYAARGGAGFHPSNFTVSGPYDPDHDHTALVQTQVHCHTTGSDGSYSPTSLVASYLAAGYEALAITDHDVVTSQPGSITTKITGNEHSPSQQHIIALDSDYTRGGTTAAQTIIDNIVSDGGRAEVAHPNWLVGMTYAELTSLTDYLGFEIHNGHCISGAGQDPVTYPGYAVALWDDVLTNATRSRWGFSVDDLHSVGAYTAYDMGRLKVWCASNSVSNIMAALVAGDFVADVANFGVTPGYPYRTPAGLAVTCPGATRIEAWGTGGALLSATDSDNHAHGFDGTEEYVRLVAIGDYTEPFSSALSDRWQAAGGTWNVSGGTLAVSSDVTPQRLILRRHRQGDFTAQVDIDLSAGGTDRVALMWNVLDDNHYFMAHVGESAVSGYNNQLAIAKTTNGGFANDSQLDNFSFDPTSGTWYTLKVTYTASTGRIRAKVWERATSEPDWQVDATDTTWKHGAFGLRANRTCQFDNLYINGFQTFYQPVAVD